MRKFFLTVLVVVVLYLAVIQAAQAAVDVEGYILWDRVGVAPLIPGGVQDPEKVTSPAHKADVLAALKLRYPQHDPNLLYAGLVEAGVSETSFAPGTKFRSMIYKSKKTGVVTQTPPVKWVGSSSLDAYVYAMTAGPVIFLKACGNIAGEVAGVGPVPPRVQTYSPPAGSSSQQSTTTVPGAPATPSVTVNNYITASGGYATSQSSQAAPYGQGGRQYFPSAPPPPYRPYQPAPMYQQPPSYQNQNPMGYLAAGALGYFIGRDHRRDNRLVVVQPPAQNRIRIINNNVNRNQVRIRVRR